MTEKFSYTFDRIVKKDEQYTLEPTTITVSITDKAESRPAWKAVEAANRIQNIIRTKYKDTNKVVMARWLTKVN